MLDSLYVFVFVILGSSSSQHKLFCCKITSCCNIGIFMVSFLGPIEDNGEEQGTKELHEETLGKLWVNCYSFLQFTLFYQKKTYYLTFEDKFLTQSSCPCKVLTKPCLLQLCIIDICLAFCNQPSFFLSSSKLKGED